MGEIQKIGWKMWREKYEDVLLDQENSERYPKHLWRSIWRYWFGSQDCLLVYPGKLITILTLTLTWEKGSNPTKKWLGIYLFSGKIKIIRCKTKKRALFWEIRVEANNENFPKDSIRLYIINDWGRFKLRVMNKKYYDDTGAPWIIKKDRTKT